MTVRTRSTRVLQRAESARPGPGVARSRVNLSVLSGGLRVVTEQVPSARSVAVGIWVGVGAVDETPALAGASHFLEHLLFKGTRNRTGHEIAEVMDAVGGEFNAFTAHEYTCYYTHVLAEQAELAIEVVSDVVLDATVTTADVEVERQVILEEIAMRDDDPEDALADLFAESVFAGHPVALPVIGSVESIRALDRRQIAGYYRRRYVPQRMVVSVAGDVDHAQVVRWVKAAFAHRLISDVAPDAPRSQVGAAEPDQRIRLLQRDSEQAHLMIGGPAIARDDRRRHALAVLTTALGGGMSSRLFRKIREEHGLAYSCYASSSSYSDTGSVSVYAGCAPANLAEVAGLIRVELATIAESGIDDAELARAQGQLTGSLVLGLEDVESRMSRIGRNVLVRNTFTSVEDELAALRAVTVDQVGALAAELLGGPLSVAVVGPYRSRKQLPAEVIALAEHPVTSLAQPRRGGSGRTGQAARSVRDARPGARR